METNIIRGLRYVAAKSDTDMAYSCANAGDGGAYPECHVAQYPLDMGKKKVSRAPLHTTMLLTLL